MAGVDPIWKFCQLLDRLIRNDKRIIDCLTAIARDYPALAPHLVDQLEARLYNVPDPYRKLNYLYVVDSLSFNVPATRDLLTRRINGMFSHSFKTADFNVKRDLDKLLIIWETQGRFPNEILEDMRERMAPTPPLISSPIDSPRGNGLFDLGDLVEWLNQNSSIPTYLASQAVEDNYELLFSRLLEGEKSRAELERLSNKIGYIDARELPRM